MGLSTGDADLQEGGAGDPPFFGKRAPLQAEGTNGQSAPKILPKVLPGKLRPPEDSLVGPATVETATLSHLLATTAAQDEDQSRTNTSANVMSDETPASERAGDAEHAAAKPVDDGSQVLNGFAAPMASPPAATDTPNRNAASVEGNGEAAGATQDSEAETIRLGEDSPEKKKRPIKTESDHEDNESPVHHSKDSKAPSDEVNSRKRKRSEGDAGEHTNQGRAPSSPRSSILSSPAPNLRSDKTDDSESISTRQPSPHIVPASKANPEAAGRKRRLSEYNADDDEKQRKPRRQINQDGSGNKDRRETRSATFTRHTSNERSQSPASRTHKRVLSTQSVQTAGAKKRRIPPPLVTNPKRGRSEDRDSISSSASGSPLPPSTLRKVTGDNSAMSPAKMAPHRKLRDQNGRTLIARACANQDLAQVKVRYDERPEDLNIPDNAGNTPLQIAALEGSAEIVKFLIDAGCEIDTKNIDKDTPLIDAIDNGHVEVVKILLDGGANPRLSNARGDEPYDLVEPSKENSTRIRKLISSAKERESKRRKSDDQSGHNSATFKDTSRAASAVSPRDSPPIFSGPRSPPLATTSRRRTVRSEATRNDLLWMRPTQDSLTEYAGKGDMEAVGQIVNMLQKAGPDSLIAAAKAGHHEVIGLLFALGEADPDPDPIRGKDHKPGFNTPMLAAIGKGHEKVIELLLSQSGFNPSRRVYRDLSYPEISKDRKGENWEKEYRLLKDAFDKYSGKDRKGRKSDPVSPRKAREKDKENRRATHAASSSPVAHPHKAMKEAMKSHRRDSDVPSKRLGDSVKHLKREGSGVTKDKPSTIIKRPRVRETSSMDRSAVVSDQEAENSAVGLPKKREHKTRRSVSDLPPLKLDADGSKRRRLISKRAFRSEEEQKRKNSSVASLSADEGEARPKPVKLDTSRDKLSSLKRPRTSVTPSRSRSLSRSRSERPQSGSRRPSDELVKKRRRVQPEESLNEKTKQNQDVVMTDSNENIQTAEPQKSPPSKPSVTSEPRPHKTDELKSQSAPIDRDALDEEKLKEEGEKARIENEAKEKAEAEEKAKAEAKAEQERHAAEIERQKEELKAKEEAARLARIAKEEEEARLEEQRKAEEEARLARLAREEEERLEKKRQAEKRAEEERLRRIEQERLRREEAERRRLEQERRERAAFLERQAAEERKRREALPNSLCKAAELAELNHEAAIEPNWVKRFFPLYTATMKDLDPGAHYGFNDRWIVNFQVAPLLGIKDLQLSQFSHWEKRYATDDQKTALWRVARRMLAESVIMTPSNSTTEMALQMDRETMPKFLAMEHVFWVRLSDFEDLIPRFPHLQMHLPLPSQKILLQRFLLNPSMSPRSTSSVGHKSANGVEPRQASPNAGTFPLSNGVSGPNGTSIH